MEPRSQGSSVLEPLPVPVEELYRMSPEVYQGMVEHGLLNANGQESVELVDGLLVVEGVSSDPIDRLYRIPLGVYLETVEIGLLGPSDRVVLLDGILVNQMGKGNPHTATRIAVVKTLMGLVPNGWHVRFEAPVAMASGPKGRPSAPEPDVTVARGEGWDYIARTPTPADTAIVIEVAESSLRKDRKGLARYSWTNIPVAWIINLNERTVEVYSRPTGPVDSSKYQESKTYSLDDEVPVVLDGQEVGKVAVRAFLR